MSPARKNTNLPLLTLLILLPAVIMAVVGFQSLRQDKVIAHAQVLEMAQDHAGRIVDSLEKQAGRFAQPPLEAVRSAAMTPDELKGATELPELAPPESIACLIDRETLLLWPASTPRLRPLQPHFISSAPPRLRSIWREGEDYLIQNNPVFAEQIFNQLAEMAVDRQIIAVALSRKVDCLMQMQEWDEAKQLIDRLGSEFAEEETDFGVPFSTWVRWRKADFRLLSRPASETDPQTLSRMAIEELASPDHFTNDRLSLIGEMARQLDLQERAATGSPPPQDTSRGRAFLKVWNHWIYQQEARLLHQIYQGRVRQGLDPEAQFQVTLEGGKRYLATVTDSIAGNRWLIANRIPATVRFLQDAFEKLDNSADFEVAFRVFGRTDIGLQIEDPDATASGGGFATIPPFEIAVAIKDTASLLARQRNRNQTFAIIIAISCVAVAAGCIAIWRAIANQQNLSRMRSNFVSSVSHELRTPLASVQLMAEELSEIGGDDPERTREYNRFILQECRRLSGLVENVLDFSKIENDLKEYRFQPSDLLLAAENTARLLQVFADENDITIQVETSGTPVPVEADAEALQQVLVNLIDNAIKHSPHGAAVTLNIQFGTDRVVLGVTDQGPGIAREDQSRVFDEFFRCGSELRRETKGVGLGLAIARHVVRAHRGSIQIESTPGQGTTFLVELPITQPRTAASTTFFRKKKRP